MASKISVQVTGESLRLKLKLLRKKTLGGLEVLGMSETILEGALVKNKFKAFAMEEGSVCLIPTIYKNFRYRITIFAARVDCGTKNVPSFFLRFP